MQPLNRARAPSVVARLLMVICIALAIGALLYRARSSAAPAQRFTTLPAGDVAQFFDAATVQTRKLVLSGETRNAMLAEKPLRRALTPTPGQRLQITMALVCPPPDPCAGAVSFRVDALRGTEREPLLRHDTPFDSSPPGWHTEWIDLDRLHGRATEIELSIESVAARDPRLLGRSAPTAVWGEPLLTTPTPAAPNVLLISIDTLRADRLGSYGYARPTSPNLDAFAADAVRFASAISQSPWTTPSHMSLLTSLYPSKHRVNLRLAQQAAFQSGRQSGRVLAPERVTLAETLRANGYHTVALTGGATIAGDLGFFQGFDVYGEQAAHLTPDVGTEVERWLDGFGNSPFFLFLHTFEVHAPYRHLDFARTLLSQDQAGSIEQLLADTARQDGQWIPLIKQLRQHLEEQGLFRSEITSAMYDGGIVFADRFVGDLLASLRRRGLYDRTIIVVTSDHGEEFGEHDPTRIYSDHCRSVYDELVHIPLLIRTPDQRQRGRVVQQQVESIDIAPTILAAAGLAPHPDMQGENLAPLMHGGTSKMKTWALSEATCDGPELKGLRTATSKYVASFEVGDGDRSGIPSALGRAELYDLRTDPREQHDRAADSRADAERLRVQLHEILDGYTRNEPAPLNAVPGADVSERLRALGYMP